MMTVLLIVAHLTTERMSRQAFAIAAAADSVTLATGWAVGVLTAKLVLG